MSDTLRAIDAQQGFEGLAAVVAEEAKSVRDFDSIFLLRSDDGSFRAGNVQNVRAVQRLGRTRPRLAADGRRQGRPRRPLLCHVDAGLEGTPAGRQQRPCDCARCSGYSCTGSAGPLSPTIMLAVGSAIYLARRAQQKIDVFATTLSKVSRGEISERVPVTAIARRSRPRRGADQRHAGASAEADRERQSGLVRHRPRLEEADRPVAPTSRAGVAQRR